MLYNAVLVSAVQQSESAICIHISPLFWFPSHSVTTENWVEFPVLYSRFSLVIYFIHGINGLQIYVNPNFAIHLTPLSLLVSIHLFSVAVSLFLICKKYHLYHFSKFPIYILKFHPFAMLKRDYKGTKTGPWRPAQSLAIMQERKVFALYYQDSSKRDGETKENIRSDSINRR